LFGFLAVFIGALTAVQSRLNGQLSKDIHSGLAAALISFITGWIFLIILVFGIKKERKALKLIFASIRHRKLLLWEITGGVIGGFFVSVQSITVPVIGVALFTISVVAGQTASSLVVDKIGLSPSGKKKITTPRVIAAVVTLISVFIAVFPDLKSATFNIAALIAALIVGTGVSVQQAFNGRVIALSKSALATAFLNFLMGAIVITIALTYQAIRGLHIAPLPHNLWIYLGGPIGLIFVAVSAYIIKGLGVLNFILLSVTGQLAGALACDWIAPTHSGGISPYLIFGTLLTLASIAISRKFETKNS